MPLIMIIVFTAETRIIGILSATVIPLFLARIGGDLWFLIKTAKEFFTYGNDLAQEAANQQQEMLIHFTCF